MASGGDVSTRPIRALFVNTRSALGADVAVHLSLIEHFDPSDCVPLVATNERSVDLDQTLRILHRAPGVRTHVLPLGFELSGRRKPAKAAGAVANVGELLLGAVRTATIARRAGADIVHSTDRPRDALVATMVSRLSRLPNLVHVHIKWYPGIGRLTSWALAQASGVLAISQFVRGSLLEGGVQADRLYTVLNATDTSTFDPTRIRRGAFRQAIGVGADVPLIGVVARIMVWKGQLEAVEALAKVREQVPNAMLVLVGNEDAMASGGISYGAALRERIAELHLENAVIWAGWHDDMPQVFADLDVVCVPSYEEPFGLVVTEAMAMEQPIVAFSSGGIPEIVEDGVHGLLAPQRDVAALADRLVRLLRDSELRQRMGQQGRQHVLADFRPERQSREVAEVYRQVLRRAAVRNSHGGNA